jgi:uncharacterized protein (TIRG00374 family)
MDRKRILITGVVLLVLAILVYFQFRTWSHFDWHKFRATHPQRWIHVAHAVALTYLAYALRAVRWKIFLRPVRPETKSLDLLNPTLVGFTGLALLGRPGELIRPYLIARRVDLPVSSQIAVWAVERIFDIGAFAVLLSLGIFLPNALGATHHPEYRTRFIFAGFAIMGLVVCLTVGAVIISRTGEKLARWMEDRLGHLSANLGHRIAQKVREFGAGLNTIHNPLSLLQLVVVSLGMWYIIALAYHEVTHSYAAASLEIPVAQILLLMGSSMIGSMVQLPGVGGGSQLATIAMLDHFFDVPKELAASCGIMLWLVTFVSVVPMGLLLAHRERLSLRKLSEESAHAEEEFPSASGA